MTFKIKVFTIFPKVIDSYLKESIPHRASQKKAVEYLIYNIRDYSTLSNGQVDDKEFGGDPGMLLMAEPLYNALKENVTDNDYTVYLSPKGALWSQNSVTNFNNSGKNIALICGHYKGIDQRIIDMFVDEEISVGDYVLSGGELAALVVIDSLVRLRSGVIGNYESAMSDSLSYSNLLDCPRYSRPADFWGNNVPSVLRSGNFENIKNWQMTKRLDDTKKTRPDLYAKFITN